jgi:hypothetical protein
MIKIGNVFDAVAVYYVVADYDAAGTPLRLLLVSKFIVLCHML